MEFYVKFVIFSILKWNVQNINAVNCWALVNTITSLYDLIL